MVRESASSDMKHYLAVNICANTDWSTVSANRWRTSNVITYHEKYRNNYNIVRNRYDVIVLQDNAAFENISEQ